MPLSRPSPCYPAPRSRARPFVHRVSHFHAQLSERQVCHSNPTLDASGDTQTAYTEAPAITMLRGMERDRKQALVISAPDTDYQDSPREETF